MKGQRGFSESRHEGLANQTHAQVCLPPGRTRRLAAAREGASSAHTILRKWHGQAHFETSPRRDPAPSGGLSIRNWRARKDEVHIVGVEAQEQRPRFWASR